MWICFRYLLSFRPLLLDCKFPSTSKINNNSRVRKEEEEQNRDRLDFPVLYYLTTFSERFENM